MKSAGYLSLLLFGMAVWCAPGYTQEGEAPEGADAAARIAEMENRLNELGGMGQQLEALQNKLNQVQAQNEKLTQQVQAAQAAQQRAAELEKQVKALQTQNEDLRKRVEGIGAIEARAARLEDSVQSLTAQNQEFMTKFQQACAEADQTEIRVDQLAEIQEQFDVSGFVSREEVDRRLGCVSISGDIRWRGVTFDNVMTFDDELTHPVDSWDNVRFRTRLKLDARPMDNLRGVIRLSNEYRWGDEDKTNRMAQSRDIFVDNAFIEMSELFDLDLRLRVGRQDLAHTGTFPPTNEGWRPFGEGFVLLDGTPNDGSRTISFDAIRFTYNIPEPDTQVDLMWAKVVEGPGGAEWNVADDEDLYGIYVTSDMDESLILETYLLHRNRNTPGGGAPGDSEPDMWTLMPGIRVSGKAGGFGYAAELAHQTGKMHEFGPGGIDLEREAWGGYFWGSYTIPAGDTKPTVKAGCVYLSGDDPGTRDYEGWDSFYAEWPKYSELLVYTLYFDNTVPGTWTNVIVPNVGFSISPMDSMTVAASYLAWFADEPAGRHSFMGHNPQLIVKERFNKYLSGHVLGECFVPGDWFDGEDEAYFARAELMLAF